MDYLLKLFCKISWVTLVLIILLGLLSHASPVIFSVYAAVVHLVAWIFWGATFFSLVLLIKWEDDRAKGRGRANRMKSKVPTANPANTRVEERIMAQFSWWQLSIMILLTLPVVIESYLLVEALAYMWIIIVGFILYAIYGAKPTSSALIKDKILKNHFAFITMLAVSITILYVFWLAGFFNRPFAVTAEFVDRVVFSEAAWKVGNNVEELYIVKNKVGDTLVKIQDESIDMKERQRNLDRTLDFLTWAVKKGKKEIVEKNGSRRKINIILLKKLDKIIARRKLNPAKWKDLIDAVKKHTNLNVSMFGDMTP